MIIDFLIRLIVLFLVPFEIILQLVQYASWGLREAFANAYDGLRAPRLTRFEGWLGRWRK
jgi:hypothetical protein